MSEPREPQQPARPRLVRSGDVPLLGPVDHTHLAGATPEVGATGDRTHLAGATDRESAHATHPRPGASTMPRTHPEALVQERFQAPPTPAPPPRTPLRWIITSVAVVVALGTAAGWGYGRWSETRQDTLVAPSIAASNPAVARGDAVVRAYFEALSQGNVTAALALGPAPTKGSLDVITAEAYSTARQANPITNVTVPDQDATATQITASYDLGGKRVTTEVPVRRTDDGAWQLVRTTRTVKVTSPTAGQVPLTVNGVSVHPESTLELLPGIYHVSTGRPYIAYPESDDLRIEAVSDEQPLVHQLDPYLTPKGKEKLAQVARDALATCLASRELKPKGCPFAGSGKVAQGQATWRRVGPDPLVDAPMALDKEHAEIAVVNLTLDLRLDAVTTDGSVSNDNKAGGRVVMRAPVTGREEDPIGITWQW